VYGNILEQISRVWAGYPGGYKKQARGSQPYAATPPFFQSDDPEDIRSRIATCTDLDQLTKWLDRAIDAKTIDDLFE